MSDLDVLVIGSGPGGYRAGIYAALRGLKAGVVERADWGGTCLNRGCVPKKDWHTTAKLVERSRSVFAERGLTGGPLSGDLATAWRHQRATVRTVQDSYLHYMDRLGVRQINGHGRLTGDGTVAVEGPDGGTYAPKHVILATGSRPAAIPGIEPVDGRILTTDMLFDDEPPAPGRVAVVGSGVIGTEMAYILHMLGCEVCWVAGRDPLGRSNFTPQARGALKKRLEAAGISCRTGGRLASATVDDDGVDVALDDGETRRVDWVLLGTGRAPVTDGIGLAEAGVETDEHGFVAIDEQRRTSRAGVFAIGDCANGRMTANHALHDAKVAIDNILAPGSRSADPDAVPEVVYSATELARFGLDDDAAEDGGYEPAVGFTSFEANPKAVGQDTPDGFTRLLADMDEGTLLGAEVVGDSAGELIHNLTIHSDPDTALAEIARGRYNHPAMGEEALNAAETLAANWGLGGEIFGR